MLVNKSLLVGLQLVILLVLQPVHGAGLVTATRQHVKEAPHSTRLLHVTTQETHTDTGTDTQTQQAQGTQPTRTISTAHAVTEAPPRGVYAPAPCHGRKC